MLIIGIAGAAVLVMVTIYVFRVATRVKSSQLGWMSEQWLAEHNASDYR
jgi:hypothetical protein